MRDLRFYEQHMNHYMRSHALHTLMTSILIMLPFSSCKQRAGSTDSSQKSVVDNKHALSMRKTVSGNYQLIEFVICRKDLHKDLKNCKNPFISDGEHVMIAMDANITDACQIAANNIGNNCKISANDVEYGVYRDNYKVTRPEMKKACGISNNWVVNIMNNSRIGEFSCGCAAYLMAGALVAPSIVSATAPVLLPSAAVATVGITALCYPWSKEAHSEAEAQEIARRFRESSEKIPFVADQDAHPLEDKEKIKNLVAKIAIIHNWKVDEEAFK